MRQTVHDFLGRSPVAATVAKMNLGEGCAVAIWKNTVDRVRYDAPKNHTFSFYLEGGTGTRRTDAGGVSGYPGAICVMPEGCGSDWEINAPFRFVHLYLSDARLRSGFVRTHDCDARRLDLYEATFINSPHLATPLKQMAAATMADDVLFAESALAELYGALKSKPITVSAGLASYALRRIDDWIEANLDQTIHLDDLAALANLSGFHFHRMFRLSRGIAPHAWIIGRRIDRARVLLQSGQSIAEIAFACGFSGQSHLTRVFRRHIGRTPADYRSLLKG
jgi:AraC family transcriptional regulator